LFEHANFVAVSVENNVFSEFHFKVPLKKAISVYRIKHLQNAVGFHSGLQSIRPTGLQQ
jgi:hypothetical protein